ncbi:hypothetical protein ABWL39_19775 [Chitinivorax sp. PXF-14]|uniref:hypothetical protein n=1 Tax=Chitinivorax sp. PXF-14 TaxID=3230488 RepID=UPI003465371E
MPMPPAFAAHLVLSEHADTIYYADLFRIEGQVWALTGVGKSDAGRAASGDDRENDLARDAVAFRRVGALLQARYDLGAVDPTDPDPWHPVAAVVYCLGEHDTRARYGAAARALLAVDALTVGAQLVHQPYPGSLARYFVVPEVMASLYDAKQRLQRWRELTDGAVGTQWWLAPWMATAEAKGALYRGAVLAQRKGASP